MYAMHAMHAMYAMYAMHAMHETFLTATLLQLRIRTHAVIMMRAITVGVRNCEAWCVPMHVYACA